MKTQNHQTAKKLGWKPGQKLIIEHGTATINPKAVFELNKSKLVKVHPSRVAPLFSKTEIEAANNLLHG